MDEIIELLQYWKSYSDKGLGSNLGRFGLWLNEQKNQAKNTEVPNEFQVSPNIKIGFLLGHIMAFGEIWTKLAFRDLPIQHFHDFGTLRFIEAQINPTKKEIAEDSFMEQSSCFEALKRMTKNGLIKDETDKHDKRVKRVKITQKGKKILEKATHQSMVLSDLLVGDLTEDEKLQLITLLEKLGSFHIDLYTNTSKEKVIDSFKL